MSDYALNALLQVFWKGTPIQRWNPNKSNIDTVESSGHQDKFLHVKDGMLLGWKLRCVS